MGESEKGQPDLKGHGVRGLRMVVGKGRGNKWQLRDTWGHDVELE
jgi:hypothetical protein